jgi:putative ABC transport system permease protein
VRIHGKDIASSVDFLQRTWKKVNPNTKFEYEFFDQQLLTTHSMMSDVAGIMSVLAFLALLISCLGLLGMATYMAETRQKEISIRKVLGSSVFQIIVLLSRSFMILLGIAVVIGIPLALIINNIWLQSFASRITVGPMILLLNVLILALITFAIVFSQAWRVSVANPVKSLRTE